MEKSCTYSTISTTICLGIILSLLILTPTVKAYGNDSYITSSSRYNLNSDLRNKSNTGWKVDKSVRERKKNSSKRWNLNEGIRRKDVNSGFNHNPTNVGKD